MKDVWHLPSVDWLSELATLVGSTRQTVNASLGELIDRGLVLRDPKKRVLLEPEELRRSALPSR